MVSVDPTQDFLCQRILSISTLSSNKQPQKQMREQRASSQRENFDPTLYLPCFTSVVCKVRDLHPWPGKTKISPDQAGGRASLMAQWGKNPPAVQDTQETWVWFLGWEDPLEKGMATRSSILAWRIPWTKETGRLQSTGLQRVGHDWVTSTTTMAESKEELKSLLMEMKEGSEKPGLKHSEN